MMTEKQFNRKKLSQVMSLDAYKWLSEWIKDQHPNYPYPMPPEKYFYSNTSHRQYLSKLIENIIIKVLRSYGADPVKAADSGRYIDTSRVVSDILGRQRKIGSGKWIPSSNVQPGRADIKCYFKGRMYNFEVKVKKDRMSELQRKEKQRAERNGEIYLIIRTVDDFLDVIR